MIKGEANDAKAINTVSLPMKSFEGRKDELKHVHALLDKKKECAIVGLGGSGKSQLARKYAQLYRQQYHHMLWINCINEESITSFKRV